MSWIYLIGALIVIAVTVIAIVIGRRQTRVLDSLRVEEDGRVRELSQHEKLVVACGLLYSRGPWFWYIVIVGLVLVVGTGLALKFYGEPPAQ